jgi:cytochrome c oxidase assembly protein subunit 15
MVRVFSRLIAPVFRPTVRALHGWALAAMISNAVVIATGAAVRLSASGLGCPDWPNCTKSSDFASHSSGQTLLNSWIEFGNRLLNFPLVAIAGLTFIAFFCWNRQQRATGRRERKDLVWLSAVLPVGVVAQAVLGGIVVLTKLNPALVAAHFLLSTAIILTAAVVLHARTVALEQADAQPTGQPGAVLPSTLPADTVPADTVPAASAPAVRIDLRLLAGLLTAVTALMLAAGTIVTGTGPLAGVEIDSRGHRTTVPRFHFSLESVTQLHADIGWFIGALAVALVLGLRYSGAPRRTVRLGWVVLAGLGLQGIIGYVQYFNHLPAGLVWVHVSLSVLIWVFVLQLYLSTTDLSTTDLSTTAGVGAARATGTTANEGSGADVTGEASGANEVHEAGAPGHPPRVTLAPPIKTPTL